MDFDDLIDPTTEPIVLGTGFGFTEGPAADAEGNVYFSDGKNDSIHFYRFGGGIEPFVNDSTDANGMMFNHKGELVVCEGAAHRIVAFDIRTRQKRILVQEIDGVHFNEPNDLAIDAHDGFYFSDPNYSHRGQPAVMKEDAYYVSPEGRVTRVSTICKKPNGVLLSPDEKTLYLADSRGQVVYRYDVLGPGNLANETLWLRLGANPDGMTLDEHGNLYVCCGAAGVKIYSPARDLIGRIAVPYASNCVFGGPDFSTFFITSRDQFLAVSTKVHGIKPPGFRRPSS
jgi:gluconolactonase